MNPVLQYISKLTNVSLEQCPKNKVWDFSPDRFNSSFYKPVVLRHTLIGFQYNVLCTQLAKRMQQGQQDDAFNMEEHLVALLKLGALLQRVNGVYLHAPHEVEKYYQDCCLYETLLKEHFGYHFPCMPKNLNYYSGSEFNKKFRQTHAKWNFPRLIAARLFRLTNAINMALNSPVFVGQSIWLMNLFIQPFFSVLAWFYFMPRLILNLLTVLGYALPFYWLNQEERELGFWRRLLAHLDFERRWFEMGNDAAWMTGGLINCFILVGALSPMGVYLSVTLFAYDIVLAALCASVETVRLLHIYRQSSKMEIDTKEYQIYLKKKIAHEMAKIALSLASTSTLFLAMCITIPLLSSINPLFPIVGCILVLGLTIATFVLRKIIDHYTPDAKITPTLAQKYFSGNAKASQAGFFARSCDNKEPRAQESPIDCFSNPGTIALDT